jgi:hypothetical protein
LTDIQIEALAMHMREGSSVLHLTVRPTVENGFFIDLSQAQGLHFRNKMSLGGHFLYLDTAPLCDRFKALLASAEERVKHASDEAVIKDLQLQIAIFRAAAGRVDPEFKPLLRQSPRTEDRSRIFVGMGIQGISHLLQRYKKGAHISDSGDLVSDSTEIQTFGFVRESTRMRSGGGQNDRFQLMSWDLRDRSDTGYRCLLNGAEPYVPFLKLGGLVCVNDEEFSEWQIAVITRIMKIAAGRVECGLKVISRQVVDAEIRRYRASSGGDVGMSINGEYQTKLTSASDALILNTAFVAAPLLAPSIIVSSADFSARARYQISTSKQSQIIELTEIVQEEEQWVWSQFKVLKQI